MLELQFEGWFQCRLARDPDPSDEKRGVSGASFATVYEPDLDRIIRLNDPVASRATHLLDGHQVPKIEVSVRSVYVDGQKMDEHPLQRARVDLIDGPMFQCLNGIYEKPGFEPIDPFHISISRESVCLSRKDLWDVNRPDLTLYELSHGSADVKRRQPTSQDMQSLDVREATGIFDPAGYMRKRVLDLQAAIQEKKKARDTATASQQVELDLHIAGLQQRLDALTMPPESAALFESQISVEIATQLDALVPQREIPLCRVPEAAQLVAEFAEHQIQFSADAVFFAEADNPSRIGGDATPVSISWKIKDPMHWVNPLLAKQSAAYSTDLDRMLYLPAVFRVTKFLKRGNQYAIIAFEETEVWQMKLFKLLLASRVTYQFDIQGPAQVTGNLGQEVAVDLPWPIMFWLGAWDNDALSGYMKGYLQIPLRRSV